MTYITVVELSEFISFSKKHLSDDERQEIVTFIANNPESGDLMQGTGGLRKFRWKRKGGGKSGGYRIIHYYYDNSVPVFLITGFAKNQMENISNEAKNEYKKLLPLILKAYKGGGNG